MLTNVVGLDLTDAEFDCFMEVVMSLPYYHARTPRGGYWLENEQGFPVSGKVYAEEWMPYTDLTIVIVPNVCWYQIPESDQ